MATGVGLLIESTIRRLTRRHGSLTRGAIYVPNMYLACTCNQAESLIKRFSGIYRLSFEFVDRPAAVSVRGTVLQQTKKSRLRGVLLVICSRFVVPQVWVQRRRLRPPYYFRAY